MFLFIFHAHAVSDLANNDNNNDKQQ